jgi:hypothetical protein
MFRKEENGEMRFKTLTVVLVCLALAALALSMSGRSQKQDEQQDSTQMKLLWERVKVEVTTDEDCEYLQQLGIDCPERGECEVIINRWQTKQLEKRGLKVTRLQRLRPDEGPNQVEYELVKEFDLTDDGVGTVVFGPKSDKSSALSEIILGLKDKEVLVYDSDFKLLHKLSLHHPTFSKNLRYIGGIRYEKLPRIYEDSLPPHRTIHEKGSYKFELYDYKGSKLCEIHRELYYDAEPSSYSISSKGTVLERDHSTGVLTFYDEKGNEIDKTKVSIGGGDPGGGIGGGVFSDNGQYVLITVEQGNYADTLEEGMRILLFNSDGEEMWRFNTLENAGGGAISIGDNYVIIPSVVWPYKYPYTKSTYLLSREGELIKKYDNILANLICFSSNNQYAILKDHGNLLLLIELARGKTIVTHSMVGTPRHISSADIAEDARMFGVISHYAPLRKDTQEIQQEEKNIQVMLIGFSGGKVWFKAFPYLEHPARKLNLRLSDDGRQMVIQISSRVMTYRLAD